MLVNPRSDHCPAESTPSEPDSVDRWYRRWDRLCPNSVFRPAVHKRRSEEPWAPADNTTPSNTPLISPHHFSIAPNPCESQAATATGLISPPTRLPRPKSNRPAEALRLSSSWPSPAALPPLFPRRSFPL